MPRRRIAVSIATLALALLAPGVAHAAGGSTAAEAARDERAAGPAPARTAPPTGGHTKGSRSLRAACRRGKAPRVICRRATQVARDMSLVITYEPQGTPLVIDYTPRWVSRGCSHPFYYSAGGYWWRACFWELTSYGRTYDSAADIEQWTTAGWRYMYTV
jgi:hypothetical protein